MKLSQPLIGLGGRLRSGKDEVADRLVAEHGYVKIGFSDALHEALLTIDPLVGFEEMVMVRKTAEGVQFRRDTPSRYSEVIERFGYVEAKKIPEVRRLLQQLGTEVGRKMFGEHVWANIIAKKIDDHRGAGHPVVITGLRYPNEITVIEELGGMTVWVDRPGIEAPTSDTAAHASENSVSEGDFAATLKNDSTLDALRLRVDELAGGRDRLQPQAARQSRQGSA